MSAIGAFKPRVAGYACRVFERGVVVVESIGRDAANVRLLGEHDLYGLGELRETLRGLAAPRLVIDLSEVEFMDAAVLGVLLEAVKERATTGGSAVLRASAGTGSHVVGRLLELCRVDERVPVVDTEDEAYRLVARAADDG